ncbi:MAG: hypothetical protein M0P57_14475 [Syntrophales bacterium]|jgi:hypothetical protein|nr:hypothetical protein [Syntrophales bacterium]MDY0044918.1 hypothetical protein [Syntrophales bacterium]
MTHEDAGHYAAKHPDSDVKKEVLEAVRLAAHDQKISCAKAFTVVRTLKTTPREVGIAADTLEIKIEKCQLGLFGYEPEKRIVKAASVIDEEMAGAIKESLAGGRLRCEDSWNIAKRFNCSKMTVSSVCEALAIKISECQLGAFK